MTETADDLENRYRTSLGWALPSARREAAAADDAFRTTRRAMAGEAWVSTVADAFSDVCAERESSAGRAADDCVTTLENRHYREPATVPASDYRARWY